MLIQGFFTWQKHWIRRRLRPRCPSQKSRRRRWDTVWCRTALRACRNAWTESGVSHPLHAECMSRRDWWAASGSDWSGRSPELWRWHVWRGWTWWLPRWRGMRWSWIYRPWLRHIRPHGSWGGKQPSTRSWRWCRGRPRPSGAETPGWGLPSRWDWDQAPCGTLRPQGRRSCRRARWWHPSCCRRLRWAGRPRGHSGRGFHHNWPARPRDS